ncbi:MAG: hypothetical protein NW224_20420 [Leptolyngbyaceae cyanobacterium bins.302]|nr:hypothetical protein [Leptolyngbyaceae cyanobacterium bins.302]
MSSDSRPTPIPTYLETLSHAVAAFREGGDRPRPSTQAVVDALLQAEKAARQQHITYPFAALIGQWRLYFTAPRSAHQKSGVSQGRGWYVPQFALAQISFLAEEGEVGAGTIGNQIEFGSILFKLQGPLKYPGKKNLLGFDFTQAEFSILGKTLYRGKFQTGKTRQQNFEQSPVSKLPFFAFFLVTENFIAARGRGGGLAIWVRG